jgi:VWFA-related protein
MSGKAMLILALAAAACLGQETGPLVRVNVDLVQVDAIVTDAQGNHVGDLKPEEFEILENGKAQHITNFSFLSGVSGGAVQNVQATSVAGRQTEAPPMLPARLAPGQADRTIAVAIDDFGLSEQSFAAVHAALEKFVEQVGPGDLVAIVTTSGRLGALQRLTSDKRLLRAAVDKFRSLPNHRPGVMDDDFTCVWYNHKAAMPTSGIQDEEVWLAGQVGGGSRELDPQLELENDHRSVFYGLLSLSALGRLVDGLRELAGHKSILLFSEGLPLVRGQGSGETNSQVTSGYEAFLNHANRSGVTVNTIDPRGLVGSFASADRNGDACESARQTELAISQQQLRDVAGRTGGISIVNDNDLTGSMTRVWKDQSGYYLIGYKPPEAGKGKGTRGDSEVRKIAIRVTRPGLKVRFHSSLYKEEPGKAPLEDSGKRLVAAVESPFAIPNVRVRFATRFWDAGPEAGSILDTILEIDAHDLSFREDGGRRKAEFEILAVIYGSDPKPLDTFKKSYTISLTEAGYERALGEGLVQQMQLRMKQAGAYQIRGAVRDQESGHIGSASELVEVPDLTKGRLALSGIVLSKGGTAESRNILRFRAGDTVFYAYQVLNAQVASDGSTKMELRAALYHDGRVLGSSPAEGVDPKGQTDPKRLVVSKDFRLGKQLKQGDYTLQIDAVDRNAPERRAQARQTVDFEIAE